MLPKLTLFEVTTVNEQLEREFHDFFYKWNLLPLFTDADRTGIIRVSDTDARAVTNFEGAYNDDLKTFSDLLDYADDNLSYQEAMFKVIYGVKTFRQLMNNIRKVNRYIENEIFLEHQFNRWNIVFYNKKIL